MNDTNILPPPVINLPPNAPSKFEREKDAFRRLLPQLLLQNRGKYVAIHEEQVVGSGDNILDVAHAAYEKFGYQPIFVDLVTDEPRPSERLPSPRVIGIR